MKSLEALMIYRPLLPSWHQDMVDGAEVRWFVNPDVIDKEHRFVTTK